MNTQVQSEANSLNSLKKSVYYKWNILMLSESLQELKKAILGGHFCHFRWIKYICYLLLINRCDYHERHAQRKIV